MALMTPTLLTAILSLCVSDSCFDLTSHRPHPIIIFTISHCKIEEKNWIPFTYDQRLHFVYPPVPHVIVSAHNDGSSQRLFSTTYLPLHRLRQKAPHATRRWGQAMPWDILCFQLHLFGTSVSRYTRTIMLADLMKVPSHVRSRFEGLDKVCWLTVLTSHWIYRDWIEKALGLKLKIGMPEKLQNQRCGSDMCLAILWRDLRFSILVATICVARCINW